MDKSALVRKTGKLERIEKPEFVLTPHLRPFVDNLRKSKDPMRQAMAQLIESGDIQRQETQWQTPKIIEVVYQTSRTNGRVTRIEFLLLVGKIAGTTAICAIVILYFKDPALLFKLWKLLIP